MNFRNKFYLILKVIRKSTILDFLELFGLFNFLFKGGKIFMIFSPRIGHQMLNTIAFISYITPEESSKNKIAIANPSRISSNTFITNFWTKYLRNKGYRVFTGDLSNLIVEILLKSSKSDNEFVGHSLRGTKEFYLSTKKQINFLYHNRNDCGLILNKKYQPLPKLKLKLLNPLPHDIESLKFICTHTRDSEYLNSFGFENDFSYHDYRNDDYLKLIPTVQYLNSKSLPVVRMGNVKRKLDNKYFSEKHIDFKALSNDGSDDIRLCSNCLFFIGDTSGLALVPAFFGRPVLRYNWVPIFNSLAYKTLVIPMLIKDINKDELLPFRKVWELKEKGLNISDGFSYKKYGLKCIKNTSSEIQDASKEMLSRVQENDFISCHPQQKLYEQMMESIGWPNPGIVGYSFMEKYGYLFC